MATTKIIQNSSKEGKSTIKGGDTFSGGDVWLDFIFNDKDAAAANVMFTPCARTHWHTHEKGQILQIVVGSGWICDKGGKPRRISAGDFIWAPPGTTHWHGADKDSYMTHMAVGIGETKWLEAVTDDEYNQTKA
ncbi:MAG: hypothetical protein M1834_003656 [Cirrosporium novae-zelandiae]|nr:MAG: hypothetical protein M1834_003656 [Cirrosporium novae-zelandiae]